MGYSATALPENSVADQHIAWCLREVLNGTLSVGAAHRALETRFVVLLNAAPPTELGFDALVVQCRRDGVPLRFQRTTGDWDDVAIMQVGIQEIVAAQYRGRRHLGGGARDANWHRALSEPIENALARQGR